MARADLDIPVPTYVEVTPEFTGQIVFTEKLDSDEEGHLENNYRQRGAEVYRTDIVQIFISDSHENQIPPRLSTRWTLVWQRGDPSLPPAVKPPLIPLPFRNPYTGEVVDGRQMKGLDN